VNSEQMQESLIEKGQNVKLFATPEDWAEDVKGKVTAEDVILVIGSCVTCKASGSNKSVETMLGLNRFDVRHMFASSEAYPPSSEELRHEARSYYVQRYLPDWVVTLLQKISRLVRARQRGLI
jgi:hypothetical protein